MGLVVLLSLLGLAATFAAFDIFGSDDDPVADTGDVPDDIPSPPDDPDDPILQTINLQPGQSAVTGSEDDPILLRAVGGALDTGAGNDTIEVEGGDNTVHAGPGDDALSNAFGDNNLLDGGPGNDTFELREPYATTVHGGEGDDTLTGNLVSLTTLDGGDGNDEINITVPQGNDETSFVDGGAGDDTINAEIHMANALSSADPVLSGGPGSDQFNLTVTPLAHPDLQKDAEDGVFPPPPMTRIDDFEPGNDQLHIDPGSDDAPDEGLTFSEARVVETEDGTDVYLCYDATEDDAAYEARIHLAGVTGLTLDDLSFGEEPGRVVFETNAGDTVTSGAGDDNVAVAGNGVFDGGGGDDTISVLDSARVSGGPGDDEIANSGDSYGLQLDGSEGNDTLTAADVSGGEMNGGDGDDVINLAQASYDQEPAFLNGGDGDDSFTLDLAVAQSADLGGGVEAGNWQAGIEATGGAGADSYTITFGTPEFQGGDGQSDTDAGPLVNIRDFTPEEDHLVIDLAGSPDVAEVQSVETQTGADGTSVELVVVFVNTQGQEFQAIVNIGAQDAGTFDPDEDVTVLMPAA